MIRKLSIITAVVTALMAVKLWGAPTGAEILEKIDYMQDQHMDITCRIDMTQQRVGQGIKDIQWVFYRKDKTDSILIVETKPETEKGRGYLRVENNFFLYLPNTRTFQTINRDESIGGSDAKAGDFEKRKESELYRVETNADGKEMIEDVKLGSIDTYKVTLTGIVNDVTYPKQVLWLDKETFVNYKIQNYSLSGTLMQTAYYPKWTEIDGKYIWVQAVWIDEFDKGNKTIAEMSAISLAPLDDSIFTKPYLENLSK
jgi:outer membrane lipoprotein-sorting protein